MKPKYTPSITQIDLNNRRELLNEGVKSRNNICLYHKYPHLAPAVFAPAAESPTKSPVVISTDFSALCDDPLDKLTPLDSKLLHELLSEFLHGPTITPSVAKKVHAYLLHVCQQDRHFRRQLLGGVPHSDALKFAATLCTRISDHLAPESKDGKLVRKPVHTAVQLTLATLT